MLGISHWNAESAFLHWDGFWYKEIVDTGYDNAYPPYSPGDDACSLNSDTCLRNFAFFPMYPMLVKGLTILGVNSFVAGFLVSNVLFLGAILLLFKLAMSIFNDEKKAYLVAFAMMFIPSAYVFAAYMTESTFVFLLILAYYFAFNKKWLLAGFVGMLLSATRNTGVFFGISYLLIFLEQNNFNWKLIFKDKKFLIGMALIPLGLLFFMLYLKLTVGDPLAFVNVQVYWRGPQASVNPILGFIKSFYVWIYEVNIYNHIYDIAYFFAFAGLFLLNLKKKWLPLSLSTILLWIVIPMTIGSTKALPRYAIVLFPFYLFLPFVLKNKLLKIAYFTVSIILMILFSIFYTRGMAITI
jgi:Gpi18-like mannosyltransferase